MFMYPSLSLQVSFLAHGESGKHVGVQRVLNLGILQNFLRFSSFPSSHVNVAGTSFRLNSSLESSGHGHDGLQIVGHFSYTAGIAHLCKIKVSFRAAHSHDFSVPGLISNLSVLV